MLSARGGGTCCVRRKSSSMMEYNMVQMCSMHSDSLQHSAIRFACLREERSEQIIDGRDIQQHTPKREVRRVVGAVAVL